MNMNKHINRKDISEENKVVPNKVAHALIRWYEPVPMTEPKIDKCFLKMNPIAKAVETIRYSLDCFMWNISRNGTIQAFWKLYARVALIVIPFLILVGFILTCVAFVFNQFERITHYLTLAMKNIMWTSIFALIMTIAISLIISLILRIIIPLLRKKFIAL